VTGVLPGLDGAARPADDAEQVWVAARRCQVLAARVDGAAAGLARDGSRLGTGWRGPAAAAAAGELAAAGVLLHRVPPALAAGGAALSAYARAVEAATRTLALIDAAYADACWRQERDRRSAAAAATALPGPVRARVTADLVAAQEAELRSWLTRRAQVLDDVAEVARRTGRALQGAAAQVVVGTRGRGPVTAREPGLAAQLPMLAAQRARSVTGGRVGAVPPAVTAAELVTGWWTWLTGDERARLVRARPAAVGRLTGLPAVVRDVANRRVLARDLAVPRPGPTYGDWRPQARRWAALAVSAALARVPVDPMTRRPVAVRLVGYAPAAFGGDGRVVVAVGDPDTAENVAVLVPGMDNDLLHSAAGLVDDAARVRAAARRLEPAETTAAVGWLNYEAPGLRSVASAGAALAAGPLLARDLRAVAGRPVAPHLTVVGHSYGTVAVGVAQRAGPTGASDVVLLGSPGAGVGRAAALNVPPGHVYVGASSRDPVSYVDRFGLDPTHERFGAVRFQAEDPTRNPSRLAVSDHLKYYRPGSESLTNLARVVAGDGDQVDRAPYRHELRWRPDGISSDPETDRRPTP
jgi:hypothetical protein